MRKLFIVLTMIMAIGCQSQTDKTKTEDPSNNNEVKPVDDIIPDNIAGCYMQVLKRDTFAANLQQHGNVVTGRLSFDNYEKDGSSGAVNGKLQGDVLKLVYTFASEGMNSVMEVYFKYEDGGLVRGIGEMETKGDSAYFISPASIKYDGSGLKKIPCEDLPQKEK